MSAEVSDEKRQRSATGDDPCEPRPAKKAATGDEGDAAAKESRACAGMTGKVGDGKDVEEFRNYEDSDRHSVRAACKRIPPARSPSQRNSGLGEVAAS